MSEVSEIKCDSCGRDLTYTGNSVDYRLALINQHVPIHHNSMSCTDMMIYPPIEKDAHFCGVGCLKTWLNGIGSGDE